MGGFVLLNCTLLFERDLVNLTDGNPFILAYNHTLLLVHYYLIFILAKLFVLFILIRLYCFYFYFFPPLMKMCLYFKLLMQSFSHGLVSLPISAPNNVWTLHYLESRCTSDHLVHILYIRHIPHYSTLCHLWLGLMIRFLALSYFGCQEQVYPPLFPRFFHGGGWHWWCSIS